MWTVDLVEEIKTPISNYPSYSVDGILLSKRLAADCMQRFRLFFAFRRLLSQLEANDSKRIYLKLIRHLFYSTETFM